MARRAAIFAVKLPRVAQLDVLRQLTAVQELKTADRDMWDLLEIFTYKDLDAFNKWAASKGAFLKAAGLELEECRRKMQYLSICSHAAENSEITYQKLAQILGIKKEEVETWVMDAILNELIDARLDQLNEVVLFNTYTQRVMEDNQWAEIKSGLEKWRENFVGVLKIFQEQ